jgi:anti-sigma regulatory factor (Ser/Thr protein kinase)
MCEEDGTVAAESPSMTPGAGRYRQVAIEAEPPDLELIDPAPVVARRAIHELAHGTALDGAAQQSMLGAVSEVVTNAQEHGRGQVRLRAWRRTGGVVVTVTDEGRGPVDAGAGGRPLARGPGLGGLGLWLARQLCDELTHGNVPEGFRVRLRSGDVS